MKIKIPSAERVWKQFEDLAPRLRLSTTDRVVYTHLFRHSRLEGKLQLRFSIPWLARGVGLCGNSARWAVRRLIARGILRLVERSKAGHVVAIAPIISRSWTSSNIRPCAALSICGSAATVFTAAAGLPFVPAASTMSSRSWNCRIIPSATSSLAVGNVTCRRAIYLPKVISAASTTSVV